MNDEMDALAVTVAILVVYYSSSGEDNVGAQAASTGGVVSCAARTAQTGLARVTEETTR